MWGRVVYNVLNSIFALLVNLVKSRIEQFNRNAFSGGGGFQLHVPLFYLNKIM